MTIDEAVIKAAIKADQFMSWQRHQAEVARQQALEAKRERDQRDIETLTLAYQRWEAFRRNCE